LSGSVRQTRITGNSGRRDKKERRSATHKRLPYYFNVNRTSLDHLLLGRNADVDKNVDWFEYSAGSGRCQKKRFLNLWVWARESKLPVSALIRLMNYLRAGDSKAR